MLNPESAFLEVGCYSGGSLEMWVDILQRHQDKRLLIAVDPYHNPENYLGADANALMASALSILCKQKAHMFFRLKSHEFFEQLGSASWAKSIRENKLGFALIDGWHDRETMQADLDAVIQYMDSPGLLVLDDVSWAPGFDEYIIETYGSKHRVNWLEGRHIKSDLGYSPRHQVLIYT